MVVSCQSWHLDVFLPLVAWDDHNVSSFYYFQEHSEYSLAHLDEMMLLLHGMKSALDNTVLESQLLCYQHLLVHMIKVGWQLVFFPIDHNVISIYSFAFTGPVFHWCFVWNHYGVSMDHHAKPESIFPCLFVYACRLCLYCYISVMSTQKYKNK